MNENKKTLVCSGCEATFKHASSLSLHKNGSAKKGLKPCKKYFASICKQYEEAAYTRQPTTAEINAFMSAYQHMKAWVEHEEAEKAKPPPLQLKPFGHEYPPSHVSKEWMKERFMKQRSGDFVASMFAAFHTNTTEGREYCTIRIPKASHSNDVEVYNGSYWVAKKLYVVLYEFINEGVRPIMEDMVDDDEDPEYSDKYYRFENRWSPDDADEVKQGYKEDVDEEDRKRIYKYDDMIHKIRNTLLGEKREEINSIKKQAMKKT